MAQYKHLFITQKVITEKFKQSQKLSKPPVIPSRDRIAHSAKLLRQFEQIWKEKESINATREAESIPTREGSYLSFTSGLDADLVTKSLENIKRGIRLLNIKEEVIGDSKQIKATVYIPNGMEGFFISKIAKYQTEETKGGKPKNAPLVNSIEDVSTALLESLWTDKQQLIPDSTQKWCEAWLNVNTYSDTINVELEKFTKTLDTIGIEYKKNSIVFPERAVILINANKEQLAELMLESDLLAELRAGQETAGFWMNETSIEQQEWVTDLLNRLKLADGIKVKVCILDTGVNNGHQLLQPILSATDTLTVDLTWGTNDHGSKNGHGTMMAGIVGYGDFESVLASNTPVVITHNLCSVKILSPHSETPKELWGDITSQAISTAEIQNPENVLLYCMAIASYDDVDKGRPSSWSGAIDNLTYNDGENQRLILISAGNVGDVDSYTNYPDINFVTSILNPSQSWNALIVGAYTGKVNVKDAKFSSHTPIANMNELSPYSTTSLVWDKKWPVKPDVVFEGGNLLFAPDGTVKGHNDLDLLSTSKNFNTGKPLDTFWATSAATAKASWFAAKVANEYPEAWTETIRGLMVHSASWSPEMLAQMEVQNGNRGSYKNLMRVFGYGIPDLEKALYSSESALTYISQQSIQPFGFNEVNQPETNQIHFYDLPWPKDLLLSLGAIPVTLRVTLSYYIEPGAGEIGWKDKYRYQSHGLRFDVNNVDEEIDDFRKRINVAAREDGETLTGSSGSNRWKIGSGNQNRTTGSIHSDFWVGTAAELATCNCIAVYPVIGWWRERKHLGKVETKSRYSLIVSLETPHQEVELYTTVKGMIEIPIEVKT